MNDQFKNEVIEELIIEMRSGFYSADFLFERIKDVYVEEPDFDEAWLREEVNARFQQFLAECKTWSHPTDFERLAFAFDELIQEKIICLHNAGHTKSDGEEDSCQAYERLKELGIQSIGYCYYHSQDVARAIDPDIRSLYLGFGSFNDESSEILKVGFAIANKFLTHGFEVVWSESIDERIELKNIDWKKVPDHQNWAEERVVQLMMKQVIIKKPWWKFW